MKIGFVITHPQNESMGSLIRVRELAASLVNLKHEVHILTPFKEKIEWSPLIRTHQIPPLNSFVINRVYPYLRKMFYSPALAKSFFLRPAFLEKTVDSLADAILRAFRSSRLDLDIVQGEQEIAALALARIKDKISTPMSSDLHNIWPEELAIGNVIGKGGKIFAQLQELENQIAVASDTYIVVSSVMKEYVERHYDVAGRLEVVPPGSRVKIKEMQTRDDPPKAVYAGLVVRREHVDLFVESMLHIRKQFQNAEFFITNKGEELQKIKKLSEKLRINPRFFWFRDSSDFFEFLRTCWVGALPSSSDIARKMGTPVKLFDYLSVGVPVVANDVGSWCEIISQHRVGILTEGNPSAFGKGITEFLNSPDRVEEYGKRGLDLVRSKYNWDSSAKLLLDTYRKAV